MRTKDLIVIARQLGIPDKVIYNTVFLTNNKVNRKEMLKQLKIATRVKGPSKHNQALSTSDIYRAIEPYEKMYKGFEFIGVFPIDIYESYERLEKIDYKSMKNKNRKIAIVWNTAEASHPGKHWVCLFVDFKRNSICYFDSLNNNIDYRINDTLNAIQRRFPSVRVFKNRNVVQDKKGNCGIYVILFIVSQIVGKHSCEETYKNIEAKCAEKKGFNEIINKYRKIVFK